MTTALVIGSGVAGPVAAMALQRAGVEATVHEADPLAADDSGLFFTFQANGLDALRAVGAGALVPGFATTSMRFRSGSGKCLGEVGMGEPLADGTVGVTVRRADLHGALRDEALRRASPSSTGTGSSTSSAHPPGCAPGSPTAPTPMPTC